MKTKSKKPTRKRVVKKVAKAPASALPSTVLVRLDPRLAAFFHDGEHEPCSLMANGHELSDAAAKVKARIAELEASGATVEVQHFDAQGNPITSP